MGKRAHGPGLQTFSRKSLKFWVEPVCLCCTAHRASIAPEYTIADGIGGGGLRSWGGQGRELLLMVTLARFLPLYHFKRQAAGAGAGADVTSSIYLDNPQRHLYTGRLRRDEVGGSLRKLHALCTRGRMVQWSDRTPQGAVALRLRVYCPAGAPAALCLSAGNLVYAF